MGFYRIERNRDAANRIGEWDMIEVDEDDAPEGGFCEDDISHYAADLREAQRYIDVSVDEGDDIEGAIIYVGEK